MAKVPQDNKEPTPKRSPFGGNGMSWIYFLLIGIILWQVTYTFFQVKPKDISLTEFRNELLTSGDIDKIVVVNKEFAEVF
ncbi:MAG: hypothetical protein D6816_10955, partial [Bacteroidetes bacterium]